jgi:pimeloyl-ACP methyl ester carboxylesterase
MKTTRRDALRLLVGSAAGAALTGCSIFEGGRALAPRNRMNFVLVHDSWYGPWCWDKLAPALRAMAHTVTAVDLRGGRPPEQSSLETYVKAITGALEGRDAPAILVAHGSGGIYASQAAEDRPEKVRMLVFLSGVVPGARESGRDAMKPGSQPGASVAPPAPSALCNDCKEQDVIEMAQRLVPEPTAPGGQPVRLTPERFGKVDKAYIYLSRDNANSLWKQREFAAKWPIRRTVTLDASHSPFLSMPERLAHALRHELPMQAA